VGTNPPKGIKNTAASSSGPRTTEFYQRGIIQGGKGFRALRSSECIDKLVECSAVQQ
jgi:hypothetical protein